VLKKTKIMNWIIENKEWLFSGIGILIIGTIIKYISKNKENNVSNPATEIKNENNNDNRNENKVDVNINIDTVKDDNSNKQNTNVKMSIDEKKSKLRILFIDDDVKFKIVKILNKAGWSTKIVKDIDNLDSDIILNSHILFVDINDVGVKLDFKDEGLGLGMAIKKKYPHKKVIIYSSQDKGERFHKALRVVDDFLFKNAEPFEFQQIIENFAKEITV